MDYRKNLYPGIVLSIFSIVYIALSGQIQIFTGSGATPLDARFIPRMWGSVLLLLSLILVFRGMKQKIEAKSAGIDVKGGLSLMERVMEGREVILSFVALGIYVVIMKNVGFLISTTAYIYFATLILTPKSKRNYILPLIVAIAFAAGIDFIFVRFLSVLLPMGILGF